MYSYKSCLFFFNFPNEGVPIVSPQITALFSSDTTRNKQFYKESILKKNNFRKV